MGGVRINIITTQFRDTVYDVSSGKCQSQRFSTVFDKLEFDNPNVANCLIDQKRIEQVLLIKEDKAAMELLKDVSTVPKNCIYAYTNGFNQYYPAPNYRSYAIDANPRSRPVLQTSVDEMEQEVLQEVKDLQESRNVVKRDIQINQQEFRGHEQERELADKVCRELRPKIAKIAMEIQELRDEAETEQSPDISALEEDKKLEEEISI